MYFCKVQSKKGIVRGSKKFHRFNLTPQTHVRATQGDRIFFRIPRDKLRPAGLKRLLRLERYNNYKIALGALAKEQHFVLPPQGAWVRFYIPLPRSWSQKKKDRYHGTLHQSTPDVDNLLKAAGDSLFSQDKHIAHIQVSKHWVDFPEGWIEVEISEPEFPIATKPT